MQKEKCMRCKKDFDKTSPQNGGIPHIFITMDYELCPNCSEVIREKYERDVELSIDSYKQRKCVMCDHHAKFSVLCHIHDNGGAYVPPRQPFCSKTCFFKWIDAAFKIFNDEGTIEEKIEWRGF